MARGGDAQERPWAGRGSGIAWDHPELEEGTERGAQGYSLGWARAQGRDSRDGRGQGVPRDPGVGESRGRISCPSQGNPRDVHHLWKSGSTHFWAERPQTHLEEAGQGWEGRQSPFGDQKPTLSSALGPPKTHQPAPPVNLGCCRAPQGRGAPGPPVSSPRCHPGGGNGPGATGVVAAATWRHTGRRRGPGARGGFIN